VGTGGWQPIETAPRDGTLILVGRFVKKCPHGRAGRVEVDRWRDGKPYLGFGRFNPHYWPATHWMPLPEPPEGI
jgi:hypothetical protein